MMSSMIEVPEYGWSGEAKKVQFGGNKANAARDEQIIRLTFEYASLLGSDFTEAMRRALHLALPLVLHQERQAQEELAKRFGMMVTPNPTPIAQPPSIPSPPPNIAPTETIVPPKSNQSKRSGADLI